MMPTKLYSRADVEQRLHPGSAYEVVRRTYRETARGRVLNPSKLTMHLGDDGEWPGLNAFAIDMPAYVDWRGVAGMKWAIATWDLDVDVPISSQILLFDLDAGAFKSVMEGMYLTGVRTALQSVVGLEELLPTQPTEIGLFGAGFQAKFQVSVLDQLTDVETVRIFDVDRATAGDFVSTLQPRVDADLVVCEQPREAVGGDAVITVTDSKTPVLEEKWLDDECLIALGTYQELPDATVHGADHLIVDHVEQCFQRGSLASLAERGELTKKDVDATIGDVLDGNYRSPIESDERVVFVPIGLGSLDVAIADSLHENGNGAGPVREFEFV